MTTPNELPRLIESFFCTRLVAQRNVSGHTISSYRDTFRLLLVFAERTTRRPPERLTLADLTSDLIGRFLDMTERERGYGPRTRNLRLTALRSFYRHALIECPEHAGLINRVLSIPPKRWARKVVGFLSQAELAAVLNAIDRGTWLGRRDYALLLLMMQTGLRLAEMTGLGPRDVVLGPGAHVRCQGKGRKERCMPLTRSTARVLRDWREHQPGIEPSNYLFPSSRGGRLSHDAVQDLLAKHVTEAGKKYDSLRGRRVTPHMLRHTAAMELLHAGVDRSLIAIWLGHESLETTQVYLDANLSIKEQILARTRQPKGRSRRFKPGDRLLAFLRNL
jgi:site-specific recombinase XerD